MYRQLVLIGTVRAKVNTASGVRVRMKAEAVGIRGPCGFDAIMAHFESLGGGALLLDPMRVCGREHILSAVEHAERAFARGANRSKSLLTETMLYAAGERQISKALELMHPKPGRSEYVAVLFDQPDDLRLGDISMERDDSIMGCTPEKAEAMGLANGMGIPPEDLALERVALLDLMKARRRARRQGHFRRLKIRTAGGPRRGRPALI